MEPNNKPQEPVQTPEQVTPPVEPTTAPTTVESTDAQSGTQEAPTSNEPPVETPAAPSNGPMVIPPQQTPTTTVASPIVGNSFSSAAENKAPLIKRVKLGLVPLLIIAAVVVLGGAGAVYAAIIVPNKPENVWKSALNNTNKAYDKLVVNAKQQKEVKGGNIDGSYKVDAGSVVADGTFKAAFYEKSATANMTIGASGARFTVDAISVPVTQSTYPDVYLKVGGLKGLDSILGSGASASFDSLDNKWLTVDHTLFDQLEKSSTESSTSLPQITKDDIVKIEETVGKVNRDYLFTTDPSKAVLKVNKEVGKETRGDRSVYHYEVGYDKEHLKTYVKALHDELKNTKIGEIYKNDYDQQFNLDDINKSIDESKADGTADVWVDMKTKLIRTVKFTDSKNKDNNLEISLNYNGGDSLPFVAVLNSKEDGDDSKTTLNLTLDTKKQNIDFSADFIGTSSSQKYSGNVKASFKPSDTKVDTKKPDGAVPITEVLGALFGASAGSSSFLEDDAGASDF